MTRYIFKSNRHAWRRPLPIVRPRSISACNGWEVENPGFGDRLRHQIGGRPMLSMASDDAP